MAVFLWLFILIILVVVYFIRKHRNLPPGPTGLPIIGFLHKVGGKSLHFIMHDLAKEYGDVFSVQLGSRLVVVLSSHQAIYEAYVKKAKTFAGRPDMASFEKTNHGSIGLSLCNYSNTYVYHRKNALRAIHRLYTQTSLLDQLLLKEAKKMMEIFDESIASEKTLKPMSAFKQIIPSAFLAMMFGKSFGYEEKEFLEITEWYNEWFENAEADNPPDFFPLLRFFPNKRLEKISDCGKAFEKFATNKLYEYEHNDEKFGLIYMLSDYFGKFSTLNSQEKLNLARVVADLCGGGFDTVASTLAWAPLYLLEEPIVLKKCRREIDEVFGKGPLSFEKKGSLPYFSATLYDILRRSSVGPLALPRITMESVKFRDFMIPKGTMVFANLWSCNHNPDVWEKADVLHPEHFLDKTGQQLCKESVNKLMTFSSGVRQCPGGALAFQKIFILLGTMIQNYDFEASSPPDDMLPMRGVTLKPKPYAITLKRR